MRFDEVIRRHGRDARRNGHSVHSTIQSLMNAPYQRIMILHVAIIAGGFGVMALDEPLILLLVLVVLKLAMDITLHNRERKRFAQATY